MTLRPRIVRPLRRILASNVKGACSPDPKVHGQVGTGHLHRSLASNEAPSFCEMAARFKLGALPRALGPEGSLESDSNQRKFVSTVFCTGTLLGFSTDLLPAELRKRSEKKRHAIERKR
ncbi:crcB protein [Anopheles sinensis]|uniref:CrcB protein n=1 Tax=Anopheles sinensis TaxID=74873 RepID=A0A084VVS2_ANOSI|nr:crcB protein [Anopheles sinensis]